MSVSYDKIVLLPAEKRSLRILRVFRRLPENKIKCFDPLYRKYDFIKANYLKERNAFGGFIPDGTYSLSENYFRYKIYRRRVFFESNALVAAIIAALISGVISVITTILITWLLKQLGW